MKRWFKNRALMWVLILIVGSMAISNRTTEGVGDTLQVTLPLTGLACAIASGQGVRYTGRYVIMTLSYNASKRGLGELPINERPNGGFRGMPSGHTTAAAFGAAGMAQTCLAGNPPAQVMAGLAAALVGGTRIDVGAHDVWQVMAGALWGWLFQVAGLVAFDRWFAQVWSGGGRGILGGFRAVRNGIQRLRVRY